MFYHAEVLDNGRLVRSVNVNAKKPQQLMKRLLINIKSEYGVIGIINSDGLYWKYNIRRLPNGKYESIPNNGIIPKDIMVQVFAGNKKLLLDVI